LIFATDFSPASYNAGLYASALSHHFGTKLAVAHGFTLLQAALEVEVESMKPSQQRKDLLHCLKLCSESLTIDGNAGEPILLEGDPIVVIPDLAQRRNPAITVLGTHGGGSVDRFLLGSTAEGILRNSSGPTLTVGPNVDILRAGALNIRRILYATDCTVEAAHAAPVATALAEAFSSELDVLNVVPPRQVEHPDQLHRLQEHFYGAIEAIMPTDVSHICKPSSYVSTGSPHEEILKHVTERAIDLLVLGLRRSASLGMQNRTSGAFPIIVEARCPVVAVASGAVNPA
jgi:nucleotide-binding universal stress UspA family protein